jgi:hypothetical protein
MESCWGELPNWQKCVMQDEGQFLVLIFASRTKRSHLVDKLLLTKGRRQLRVLEVKWA